MMTSNHLLAVIAVATVSTSGSALAARDHSGHGRASQRDARGDRRTDARGDHRDLRGYQIHDRREVWIGTAACWRPPRAERPNASEGVA